MPTSPSNQQSLMTRIRGLTRASNNQPTLLETATPASQLLAPERSSLVSTGAIIQGDITSPGTVHINGSLQGNVCARKMVIGRTGSLTGNCRAQDVAIAGEMSGELLCGELRIFETGRLDGTINCGRMSVSAGARIDVMAKTNAQDDLPEIPLIKGSVVD